MTPYDEYDDDFGPPDSPSGDGETDHVWSDLQRSESAEQPTCLEESEECSGTVEFRMPLSGTGRAFPRCDYHWELRLNKQEEINRKYPATQPSDFDPAYAGEHWDED